MKKKLSFLALLLCGTSSFAQSGLYIKTGLGIGSSSASYKTTGNTKEMKGKRVSSHNAIINVGYQIGYWQIESGMNYWQSGMQFEKNFGTSPNFGPYGNQSKNYLLSYDINGAHLLMPINVGFVLNKNKNVSIIPSVGIATVYNLKKKITTEGIFQQTALKTITYSANDISLMLAASMEVRYKISKHCDFWLRPTYQRMISPSISSSPINYMSSMYEYALLFNAGVTYTIREQQYNVIITHDD